MKRIFSGKAWGLFKLLKEALLDEGRKEIDIELTLDRILRDVERDIAPTTVPESDPRYPLEIQAHDFFGYVLVCEVDRSANQIRIVRFDSAKQ